MTKQRYMCQFCRVILPVSPPAATLHEVILLLGHVRAYHPADATHMLAVLPRTGSIAPIISHAFSLVEDHRRGGGLSTRGIRQRRRLDVPALPELHEFFEGS